MPENLKLQQVIELYWDVIPPIVRTIHQNARNYATRDHHISLEQFNVLRFIRRGVKTVADLAENLQISRPAISQTVDLLVEKGLVNRRQEPSDRRYVELTLTESGSELMQSIFTTNRAWMAEKMKSLTAQELDTLSAAFNLMKKSFETLKE
jgi:DNA-binding MarR family transcriptional regulator